MCEREKFAKNTMQTTNKDIVFFFGALTMKSRPLAKNMFSFVLDVSHGRFCGSLQLTSTT